LKMKGFHFVALTGAACNRQLASGASTWGS